MILALNLLLITKSYRFNPFLSQTGTTSENLLELEGNAKEREILHEEHLFCRRELQKRTTRFLERRNLHHVCIPGSCYDVGSVYSAINRLAIVDLVKFCKA
jgi:hypothetical protein